ncbi:SDR family NAD(P)-dependent oxidoreductase [Nocardioides sp.]|uniref:SDR family NAD(P)-dependent oxidoreductase n=1 Tax=Nocardioides sp. TaxID=35761 RepID=UPI003D1422D9
MAGKLAGKVAIVTGAGSGQGAAITALFIEEGAKVVLADVNEAGMTEVTAHLPADSFRTVVCDVTQDDQVGAVVTTAVREFGGVDILGNIAGIGADFEPLPEVPLDRVTRQFDVNFLGPWLFMRHTIPVMIERGGGTIINIGSVFGLFGNRGNNGAYGASKAALMHLTTTVAGNYGGDNIRVNSIAPGRIDTPLARGRMDFARGDQERAADDPRLKRPSNNPLGRVGQPSEIATAALFLASEDSSYITGAIIPVDGGWVAAGGGPAGG